MDGGASVISSITELVRMLVDLVRPWRVVQAWEGGVRVRCGRRVKRLDPGIYLAIPIIDHFEIVDVKPQVINLPNQSVETLDRKVRAVSGAVYYYITDCTKALVEVQNLDLSLQSMAMGVIAAYIGTHASDDCTIANLEEECLRMLRNEASGWGLKIRAVYITDNAPHKVLRLMTGDTPLVMG
jgi:regulator of protease activity HflC (stomatin/prohibitin superfamily)